MPKRILQVDLSRPIEPLALSPRCSGAWVLLRDAGRCFAWLKVDRGTVGPVITPRTLRDLITEQFCLHTWDVAARRMESHNSSLALGPAGELEHPPQPATVIVCTRDRADVLSRQLHSLAKLTHPIHEVIVVDNAPRNDATRRACAKHAFVRYILEPRPGLDYARNTGLRAASHDLVAYTDDDAVVEADWLSNLVRGFSQPAVQCTTGLTLPYELDTDAQEFFEQYGGMAKGFQPRLFSPDAWDAYFPLSAGRFGSGCNMAVRKSFALRIGGFDTALDVGSKTRGGGDLDFYARVIIHGGSIQYEPLAVAWHQHRRTMRQLRRLMFDYGHGFSAMLAKHKAGPNAELRRHAKALSRRWFWTWGAGRLWRSIRDALFLRPRFPSHLIALEMAGLLVGPSSYERACHADRALHRRIFNPPEGKRD